MNTIGVVFALLVAGVICTILSPIALNLAGLPGALAAGRPGLRSKARFVTGSILSAVGQSYAYLAYEALVLGWVRMKIASGAVAFVAWPIAFLACFIPIFVSMGAARSEASEAAYANPQAEAIHLTFFAAIAGFVAFAFWPSIVAIGWSWVPYAPQPAP
ncbi:MAG: hypothetical protein U1F26_10815 [Lysobacterales bacterium]